MNIIQDKPFPLLPPNTPVAIDTEWFRMDINRIHRPITGEFACLTACYRPGEVYLYTHTDGIGEVVEKANECIWVMHNAKFDITQMRRYWGIPDRTKLIDTMLIERILWNGYYDRFALDDLARRYLHIHLDKSLQEKWETSTELTPELINYSVKDADVELQVWNEQKKHLTNSDWKIYKDIELPTTWAVMNFRGFRLDVEGWRQLAENNKIEAKRLEEQLDFNPRSKQQVIKALGARGFTGIKDSQADTLESFIEKYPDTEAAKQAEIALTCKEFSTFSSKYGKKWLEVFLEDFGDGTFGFVPNFHITGAETGRMSCSKPALHQIPARTTKVFREKFIASPGNKLVIVDYSQQEIVIMAYISKDKVMMDLINSGDDAYISTAKYMFEQDIDKHSPRRKSMKSIILGIDYGMSEFGLARKENITPKEAAKLILLFRSKFPGVARYMDRITKEKTMVKTVLGRKFYLNPYSSQCARNALNAPVQGTAADMMKKAIATMHKEWIWHFGFSVVNVIHDEVVLDVPEGFANEIAKFAEDTMVRVANEMCPGMSFKASASIGDTWAEKD